MTSITVLTSANKVQAFTVDATKLSGKLAQFLAQHIPTTLYSDDASRLSIYTGRTKADVAVAQGMSDQWIGLERQFNITLSGGGLSAHANRIERLAADLLASAEAMRRSAHAYGELTEPEIVRYSWPSFDPLKHDGIEDYINKCASEIRRIGLPFDAGLGKALPPVTLLESIDRTNTTKLLAYLAQRG